MKRRDLLKKSAGLMALGLGSNWIAPGAYAADCALTEHLKGFIPTDANAALSTTGQFHHYHYLHIPQSILTQPPANGWTTISSMMSPQLGIDSFFFRRAEERKQFHCHQVFISHTQLTNIAAGKETEVVAFIRSGGEARRNHGFLFNRSGLDPKVALEQERARIQKLAERNGLRTVGTKCDTRTHSGVTVFNSRGDRIVTNFAELERLKGY